MIRILLSTRLGERKWTQADLVRETGIRASTINDLYHEMTDRVSLEQLDQICKALDCDIPSNLNDDALSATVAGLHAHQPCPHLDSSLWQCSQT